MKPMIAALAAAFLLASPGAVLAQKAPTDTTQQKKGPSSRAAVDCKKAENANNQACMKAAKDQAAAQKTKKKTN